MTTGNGTSAAPFTLVVTTIADPTASMSAHAEMAAGSGSHIVVAGDAKGPAAFDLPSTTFLSLEAQKSFSPLGGALPTASYTRKNVAYLWALAAGTDVIVETDDDNTPLDGFYTPRSQEVSAIKVDMPGWVNVYSCFSETGVWPRGFPLQHLTGSVKIDLEGKKPVRIETPIQQGLADGDPDVDAVYRMTRPLPIRFRPETTIALSPGTWSPFNSQNTTWFRDAFPLLYLPSYCSFRMTDIWRSFVAQRIAWANGWRIAFHSPNVFQERNEHDLLADFEDEVPGYLHNDRIAGALEAVDVKAGDLPSGLVACYDRLIELGVVGPEERNLIQIWLAELAAQTPTAARST